RRRFDFRKRFVARRAKVQAAAGDTLAALEAELAAALGGPLTEQRVADGVLARLDAPGAAQDAVLALAERWLAVCRRDGAHRDWPSLRLQHKVDWTRLVRTQPAPQVAPDAVEGPPETLRHRD